MYDGRHQGAPSKAEFNSIQFELGTTIRSPRSSKRAADYHLLTSRDTTIGGHLAVVPRQPKVEPNLLFIAYDLLKGRPDNCDQRASQSTATIELEYKT